MFLPAVCRTFDCQPDIRYSGPFATASSRKSLKCSLFSQPYLRFPPQTWRHKWDLRPETRLNQCCGQRKPESENLKFDFWINWTKQLLIFTFVRPIALSEIAINEGIIQLTGFIGLYCQTLTGSMKSWVLSNYYMRESNKEPIQG